MPKLTTCPSCGSHEFRVWTYESVGADWDSEQNDWGISDIGDGGTIYLEEAICRNCDSNVTAQIAETLDFPMWEDPIGLIARLNDALDSLEETHAVEFRTESDSGYGIYIDGVYAGRLGVLTVDNVDRVLRIELGELDREVPGAIEVIKWHSGSFIKGWNTKAMQEILTGEGEVL